MQLIIDSLVPLVFIGPRWILQILVETDSLIVQADPKVPDIVFSSLLTRQNAAD